MCVYRLRALIYRLARGNLPLVLLLRRNRIAAQTLPKTRDLSYPQRLAR